jgi:hypothetical protein
MVAPELLGSLSEAPLGSHSLCFHASEHEAAVHAAEFLAGTPEGQAAQYWVPDGEAATYYAQVVLERAPEHVGCIAVLPTEQVEPVDGKLRPVAPIREFLSEHGDGVSAGAETISRYWSLETVPEHLEYEAWFQEQPRDGSRFICPYDLRRVPPQVAPQVMRELGAHHSHVVLSGSEEPGARLLQLFLFDTVSDVPDSMDPTLGWAVKKGLLEWSDPDEAPYLSVVGEQVVREWGQRTSVNW